MAFIDVFKSETDYRAIYGVPKKDNSASKIFILEYVITRTPDNTDEKLKLKYLYGKYNIGDKVTAQNTDPTIGAPVPDPSPFTYLKIDGSNIMADDYVPINPKSVITLDYFETQGTGLLLGETSTTAYRGDRGKVAYNHSLTSHAPSDAEANRPISDSLILNSSTTSASSAAVKLLEDNKSEITHNHDTDYEPINANIQTHIADGSLHISTFEALLDTASYTGNQGKLVKVNATEDGLIYGDPSGTTVSWGDIAGTLANQTDVQSALDAKVDDGQVLTNVPAGAVFTDTIYDDTSVVAHIGTTTGNPHSVSVTDIGLANVDNTSDVDKPISTLTQAALDSKQDKLMTDFIVSTAYSTLDADSAKTAIVQTGGSVTLDSSTVSTGFMLQVYNDRVTDTTLLVAVGDTIKGDNPALTQGYFAYALYLGANDWAVAIGGAVAGGGGSTTFIDNTDTPANYTGSAGKAVAVTGAEDGVEFVDFQTTSVTVVNKSANYTTLLAENGNTIVMGTGNTLTLDDNGFSVGYNQIVFNDTGNAITISSTGNIKGGSATLASGYYASYVLIATGVWALSAPYVSGTDPGLSIRTVVGTTDTLILTDASKYIRCTNAAPVSITVPPNSTTPYSLGTQIHISQSGTGQVTIVEDAAVTVNTSETLKIRSRYGSVTIIKVGTDEWDIIGSLELI